MHRFLAISTAGAFAASAVCVPAGAAVVASSPNGFEVRHSVTLVAAPDTAWATFVDVGRWWSPEHSWSGDAANMTLDPRLGGCWCERWKGGAGAEHLRVTYVEPGRKMLLAGALGPLADRGVSGVMSVEFERIAGGSKMSLSYRVAGFPEGNGAAIAPLVDQVLGDQVKRFRTMAATARPVGPDPLDQR